MTLTRELRATTALVLAVLLVLTAFVWSQPRAHASLATDILCLVDQMGDEQDGDEGPFTVFDQEECESQGGIIVDWCPNLPGNQSSVDQCIPVDIDMCPNIPGTQTSTDQCVPAEVDQCPNIEGLQAAVPQGMVVENGICITPPVQGTGADLSIEKSVSDTSPTPSSTVTYTITVRSSGPQAATNVAVTDMLPSGVSFVSSDAGSAYATSTGVWTIGAMASGTQVTLHITATVVATSGVQVTNTASVAASTTDPSTGNNTASVSFTSTADAPSNETTECSDSIDNDGDGEIDLEDPACDVLTDDDESNDPSSSGRSRGGSRRSTPVSSGEVLGATTECPMYLTGYIRQGASNDAGEVAKLQVFLNTYEGQALSVSGVYDAATLAAVNAFQSKYASEVLTPWGMSGPSGYVYYTTQKQVNTIYCKFQKDFPLSVSQLQEIALVRGSRGGAGVSGAAGATTRSAPAAAVRPATVPAVGSVVLPNTQNDQNAATTTRQTTQTAAAANATTTKGWFGKFVDWLFGR